MSSKELCLSILDKCHVPINSSEPWSMHVKNEKLWDRVASQHQLGLGEAYMEGWWECEDIDEMLTRLLSVDATSFLKPSIPLIATALKSRILNMQTKSKAAKNANITTTSAMTYTRECLIVRWHIAVAIGRMQRR